MKLTSGLGGQLTVDLGALARNWSALDKVSQGALTAAVVKADAYGTGIEMAAKALHAAGARFFFVATPDEGIAVRTGFHCAQPCIERFGLDSTVRASLAFYNTKEELDSLASGIQKVVEVLG